LDLSAAYVPSNGAFPLGSLNSFAHKC